MRKMSLRLLRLVPIALALWGVASAQTTGTIIGVVTDAATGKPVAGALVVATSPNLQGEQTGLTDEAGNYRIGQLPPGPYKLVVQLQGYKPSERSDIRLSADKTLRANMTATPEAVQLEEQVVRTGLAPVVNVGSAETGSVVSREFIANVPVGRSFQELARTAAQAAGDQYGVGFQGAQSPENSYILDGLNITDPVYGAAPGTFSNRSAPTLLSNFVQEVDVKTGSFMPEYGRATGGIINVVTKGGSNEYHGSVFANLRPDGLATPNGKVTGSDGQAVAWYRSSSGTYNTDFGFEVGGPIMKDKLWFYAGFAPIIERTYYDRYQRTNVLLNDAGYTDPGVCRNTGVIDANGTADTRCRDDNGFALNNKVAGSDVKVHTGQTSYQWVGKLSYLIDADNTVSVATYGQPSTQTAHRFQSLQNANANLDTAINSADVIGKYTGKFLDKRLVLDVAAGWHNQRINNEPNAYQDTVPFINWQDPNFYYGLSAFEPTAASCDLALARCPVRGYTTGGGGFTEDNKVNRLAGKAALSYLFSGAGQHNAKIGIDLERNTLDHTKDYSGGYSFQTRGGNFRAIRGYGYFLVPNEPTNDPNGVVPTPKVSTSSSSNNFAYFLQDSWQIQDIGVTLNAGIRLETQSMEETSNPSNKLDVTDSWAPRVQAIWDFTGTGRGKVSGSYGRFFWAVPLDMGDRTFGQESQIQFREPFNPCFPQLPQTAGARNNPGGQIYGNFDPTTLVGPDGRPACAALTTFNVGIGGGTFQPYGGPTPVQPGLKAASVDMFGGQLEYEVISDLSVGFEYAGRRQVNIIEDMSPDDGNHFFIANPGSGATWTYAGTTYSSTDAFMYDTVTGRTIPTKFPKAERSYDGFTVKATKNLSHNWQAQASYTYSVLRGNYEGPYIADYTGGALPGQGQLDPGITAAFDLPSLLYNTKGYLPSDRPHTIKLFGSYTWPVSPGFNVTGGAGYTGQSGRPNTALGGHDLYGSGLGYIMQRGFAGRTPFTHALDLHAGLSYVIDPPYEVRFSIDVFNVLNQQEVQLYDQNYTFDQLQIVQNAGCKGDFVGTANPAQKLQDTCPDMKYLRTLDGRPVGVNPSWGKPAPSNYTYQTPIQLRFGLALAF